MVIKFKNVKTESLGRNGMIQTTGVEVFKTALNTIMISPITSKGDIGRCNISIPIEDVPEIIKALKLFQNRS